MGHVLGLLGGVASGKSTLAGLLAARGWVLLDADALARQAVERPAIRAALARRFGGDLFEAPEPPRADPQEAPADAPLQPRSQPPRPPGPAPEHPAYEPSGPLNRPLLAQRAFADPTATADLNAIVHPWVRQQLLAGLAGAGSRPVVLDVPLLLESPLAERVDTWLLVRAPETAREARSEARGWSPGERSRRESAQADLPAKARRADHVLENSGTIEDLERRLDALLLKRGLPTPSA
ncbi:MAG: hypothetical protein DRQ55_08435 [Planctomycetota bacterium]|nr:MAG: hypothetical protein DRQ55_08435 [Planctomycetota bacterium]